MKREIAEAEMFRNTLFVSESRQGFTAALRGAIIGRVKHAHKEQLIGRSLAFMATQGMKHRRLIVCNAKGQRTTEDIR